MTVFVVTSGDYSDYQIRAMFTTKERAETYIKAINLREANDIEEWELDRYSDDIDCGRSPFRVFMAKNGAVRRADKTDYDVDKTCKLVCYFPRTPDSVVELECTCWAKDEEHAIKIANEKRAQIIAMNLWREVSEMPKRGCDVEVMV